MCLKMNNCIKKKKRKENEDHLYLQKTQVDILEIKINII